MTTRPAAAPDVDRRWFFAAIGVLTALVLLLGVQTWARGMRPSGNDFMGYLLASRALWQGANPYAVDTLFPFIYPLFLCVVIWPLTQIPYGIAVAVWYAGAIGALGVTFALAGSLYGKRGQPRRWVVAAAIVCVLLADVVQNNVTNGQVNILVLALCLWFAWLWARGRRLWASTALAAAIALKITPIVLLVFMARRRAWREIALAVVVTAVFVLGLPWLVAGSLVAGEYEYYARTFLTDRLADATTVVQHHRAFGLVEVIRQAGVSWVGDAIVLAALLSIALFVIDRGASKDARAVAFMVCLYAAASLLISPMSEIHHLVFLMPGLVVLTWRTLAGRSSIASGAGLAIVLMTLVLVRFVPFAAFAGVAGTCALLAAAVRRQ